MGSYRRNKKPGHTRRRQSASTHHLRQAAAELLESLQQPIDSLDRSLADVLERLENELQTNVTFDHKLPNPKEAIAYASYPKSHEGRPRGTVVIECRSDWEDTKRISDWERPGIFRFADQPISLTAHVEPNDEGLYRLDVRGGWVNEESAFQGGGGWTHVDYQRNGLSQREVVGEIQDLEDDILYDIEGFLDAMSDAYDIEHLSDKYGSRHQRQARSTKGGSRRTSQRSQIVDRIVARHKRADDPADQLDDAFDSSSVPGFTGQLSELLSDEKVEALLRSGLADGTTKDDVLKHSTESSMSVDNLKPTQNEIGFDESIQNILDDSYGTLDTFLQGDANVGPDPIVTYAGEFVIDGHHRWSKVFVANRDATVPALNIAAKSNFSPVDVLQAVHAAIGADLGKVPQNTASGNNVLGGVSRGEVEKAVDEHLTPDAMEVWKAYTPIETEADLIDHLHGNLEAIAKRGAAKGAPDRGNMPQTDVGGDPSERLDALEEGLVNIAPPYDTS